MMQTNSSGQGILIQELHVVHEAGHSFGEAAQCADGSVFKLLLWRNSKKVDCNCQPLYEALILNVLPPWRLE